MSQTRTIAVFTGNRAEYGLQFPILRAIAADPRLEYRLIVGGAHLQEDFGKTAGEIAKDGFDVAAEVQMTMRQDTLMATAEAIGTGIVSLASVLGDMKPDFLVVYGDRYESFAAMIAGTQMSIPTGHIEGGDYTEGGALDDSVRHAMTKLAHLHFATNEQAAERIRRLGEEDWRIFVVGQPSLDLIDAGQFASPQQLEEDLGLDPGRPIVLFCQHSVATEADLAIEQVEPSLEALKALAADGFQVVATYPNNDAGGRRIIERLEGLRGLDGVQIHPSLGRWRFHGVLNLIGRVGRGAFVGNSSAGIKETPVFGCPVVNVGPRQQGRLRADNVLDVPYDAAVIAAAVRRATYDEAFREQCQTCSNPYGAGDAGARIAEVLATMPLDKRLIQKRMTY
jgi:UDP-N-acetylglucosamine 2-epimerase (non-hydrolysing)/GDP/UDP-N,N'-diacetylbacillosamine 2-epimerase (hydrolysing)